MKNRQGGGGYREWLKRQEVFSGVLMDEEGAGSRYAGSALRNDHGSSGFFRSVGFFLFPPVSMKQEEGGVF